MAEILDTIRTVLTVIVSLVLVGLCIAYGVLFKWRKTVAGTSVFLLLSSLSVVVVIGLIMRSLPDGHVVRSGLGLVVILYVAYALGWMFYALVYNWRRAGITLDLERRASNAQAVLVDPPTTKEDS